jgi:nucleoside-diphosphate-sugar epimerase
MYHLLRLAALCSVVVHGAQAMPTVCVTGGNGYIASELTKQLLDKGYHVRASVRSLAMGVKKFRHLLDMGLTSPGSLDIVEGDLMVPGSFDACLVNADYLFHTASPATGDWESDPFLEIIQPAVQGMSNLRSACLNSKNA